MKEKAIDWLSKNYQAQNVGELFKMKDGLYTLYPYFLKKSELDRRKAAWAKLGKEALQMSETSPMGYFLNQFAKNNGVTLYLQLKDEPSEVLQFPIDHNAVGEIKLDEIFQCPEYKCVPKFHCNIAMH